MRDNENSQVDSSGKALVPVTVGGVTLAPGSTPEQRFAAHVEQQTASQWHTPATTARMGRGEADAAIDAAAVAALNEAFGKLLPDQRNANRAAYQADLHALFEGKPASGKLAAAVAKADRDARVQNALRGALAENKSPAELQQTLDNALAPVRDTSGRFVSAADQGARSVTLPDGTKVYASRSPVERAEIVGQFVKAQEPKPAAPQSQWNTVSKSGEVTLSEEGTKMQAELIEEFKGLPKAEQTPDAARVYQAAIYNLRANAKGMVGAGVFAARDLSGYRLPSGWYSPAVIHDLARARAGNLTQAQVEAIIAAERGK